MLFMPHPGGRHPGGVPPEEEEVYTDVDESEK